jgi:hypothetical protein
MLSAVTRGRGGASPMQLMDRRGAALGLEVD